MSKTNSCNQCGVCCKLFYINLNKAEYQSGKYKTIFDEIETIKNFLQASKCGANFLAKNEDGSCIYLENNLCKVHTARPTVCRAFFCDSKNNEFKDMQKIIGENINS